MALVWADRVKETTTTTGTGTVSLGGAATGFQTFVAGIGNANTCHYCIAAGSEWEVGLGTVTDSTPDTLSRTTVYASSNANALVSFSAGTKDVFVSSSSYLHSHILTDNDTIFTFLKTKHRKFWQFMSDFDQTLGTTGSDNGFRVFGSGTGNTSAPIATTATNRVGVCQFGTGTTATGRVSILLYNNPIRLSGGSVFWEADIRVPTLSTSAERFQCFFGIGDTETAINQVDAVGFVYDEGGTSTGSTASANFQCVTANNSTRTFTTSSTAVAANTWHHLTIEINAAGTQVLFYVDYTLVATHTTNIPTGSGRETSLMMGIFKSVGTTSRTLNIDYVNALYQFTTER